MQSRTTVRVRRQAPSPRRLRLLLPLALLVCVPSIFVDRSEAHQGATGIVKERMDGMTEMACAMKTVGEMVKGRRALDLDEVAALANTITSRAAEIPTLFPDTGDSRNGHRTEARPTIWERWPAFVSHAQRLEEEGKQLEQQARGGADSQVGKQLKSLGKACGACHKDFRKKKKRQGRSSPDQACTSAPTRGASS